MRLNAPERIFSALDKDRFGNLNPFSFVRALCWHQIPSYNHGTQGHCRDFRAAQKVIGVCAGVQEYLEEAKRRRKAGGRRATGARRRRRIIDNARNNSAKGGLPSLSVPFLL